MKKTLITAVILSFITGAAFAENPFDKTVGDAAARSYKFKAVDKSTAVQFPDITEVSLYGQVGEISSYTTKEVISYVSHCEPKKLEESTIASGIALEITPSKNPESNKASIAWDYKKVISMETVKVGECKIQQPNVMVENGDQEINLAVNESITISGKKVDFTVTRIK